jgi:type I restriction enzyme R subunit
MPPTPEQLARQQIDAMLIAAGWVVQDYRAFNPSAAQGVALREVPLNAGRCDYLLLIDRKPVGVVEAKKTGTTLSAAADQSSFYAENLPEFLSAVSPGNLPFLYESTGVETFFRDERDPEPRSRRVFSFHRPETLAGWLTEPTTLRRRLTQFPSLATDGMRACQIEAIVNLEKSFRAAHQRSLIQMATGAGKTYTACAFTYRLIKYAGAKRVLFLVDRSNLGRQAKSEFDQFVTPETGRKFTELYNVQHLTSNQLDSVSRVTICTIQRLYSMLRGEELPEDADELSTYEVSAADSRPKDVAYNPTLPIETFDFIVTDECHRSIYNLWRQVLEYFDAFLIGLTATPSKQTIGFFNQNLVTEYNHERAVADGVNVGYEVYRIKTQVTEQGGLVEKGFYVDKRSKLDRSKRWEQLDEDLSYAAQDLDRSVVVPAQIRTVLQTLKDALFTELFPGRTLVPKTLIFTKDDCHAEDVVTICREVFAKGNDFCKKITYQAKHPETGRPAKCEELIQQFRTSPQLRIAVTVDMIATGTDIKPLECLLFLRDVRSRVYFEQMKGRGTRVLSTTDLQAVSGEDARAKTHFVIVDAVGVCESDKTDSRPLERQPTIKFDKLLLGVALGKRDEDTLITLAGRLARLDRELDPRQRQEITQVSGGKTLAAMSALLLRALDPDAIAERATGKPGASPAEVAPDVFEAAQKQLILDACAPFDQPAVRETLVKLKQQNEQTIDTVTIDTVLTQGFDAAAKEKAATLVKTFREFIERHKAEIAALQLLYSRPYRQRLTEPMLKELEQKLRENHAAWTEDRLWDAFAAAAPGKVKGRSQAGRFADLVSLVRFALEHQPMLKPFAESVTERFNDWLTDKATGGVTFQPEQLAWLNLIRDHIATSLSIEADDFDYAPFSQRGGLGKAHQLFGEQLPKLLDELNEVLAA